MCNSLNTHRCYLFTNGDKNLFKQKLQSSSTLSRKSFVQFDNGTKLFELMLTDIENVASDPFYLPLYKNQTLSPISIEIDNHTKIL